MPPSDTPDSPPLARVALEYSRGGPAPIAPVARWLFLIAAIPAGVTPFLKFTWSTSPLDVVWEVAHDLVHWRTESGQMLGLIAAPFFLGILIFLWQLRLLVWQTATRPERCIAFSFAGASALMSIGFFSQGFWDVLHGDGASKSGFWATASGPMMLALVAILLWRMRRRGASSDSRVTVALCAAYLANASICLIGFMGDYDAGAWLTLGASALLLINVILLSLRTHL